jgi:predicted DNA-binding transcriptional regulator AlpA
MPGFHKPERLAMLTQLSSAVADLPKTATLLRFKDLRSLGVIANYPTLKARIVNDGFPPGRMVGRNTRVWTLAEVEAWIQSRPTAGPAPRGVAATRRGRPRKVVA